MLTRLSAIALLLVSSAIAVRAEDTPAPSKSDDSRDTTVNAKENASVKASQTEVKTSNGTTTTTQEAQKDTNRAPNGGAIPQTDARASAGTTTTTQDASKNAERSK